MTWLDHVVAMPTVGCGLRPSFQSSQDYLSAFRPLLKKWGASANVGLNMDKPLNFTVARETGFNYSIEPDKLAVQFRYSYELKKEPGEIMPKLPDNIKVRKYSSLLEEAVDEFYEAFDHLVALEGRVLIRLGIVATCMLNEESLPPGVDFFVKHLARPWGGPTLAKCQVHLLSEFPADEKSRDQCHHQLNMGIDLKKNVDFILDWQRVFLAEQQMGRGKVIREHLKKCSSAALEYFERFGKGDLNYANH